MPIPVNCPNCGTGLKAPDSAAGRMVKCPRCSTPFAVSAGGEQPLGSVSAAPQHARQAAPQPQPGYENYDNYQDDDPGYRRRPPPRPSGGGIGVQLGMGIASLSVGAAGLVIGLIPCIGFYPGMVAGGIGLVLGIVGLIVAMTQQGRGIAFPIAGAATSVVAMLVTFFWTYWVIRSWTNTVDNAFQHVGQQQQQIQQFQQGFEKMAKQIERQKMNQPPFGNPIGGIPIAQQGGQLQLNNGVAFASGNLTDADPKAQVSKDAAIFKVLKDSPAKTYTVMLDAGKTYQIDLMSQQVDPYLALQNPAGVEVAANDDVVPGNLNSQIVYRCDQPGVYRITVTCLWPAPIGKRARTGPFTLKISQEK